MAYYYFNFTSRFGTSYQVRIEKRGTTNLHLTASGRPFVVSEDDDEFAFTPVRLQTGTLSIVDDTGANWRGLIAESATSRPVTVLSNNTVVWKGYIQPGGMTSKYLRSPQPYKFNVMCRLSALESFNVMPADGTIESFSTMLMYILDNVGTFSNYVFQGSESFVKSILTKQYRWSNFIEFDKDDVAQPKYNCLELLEEICKFWGFTCRTHGDDVYFVTPMDETTGNVFTVFSRQDFNDIDNSQPATVNWQFKDFAQEPANFMSTENEEMTDAGKRKVTVVADINKSDTVLKFPFDTVEKACKASSLPVSQQTYGSNGHHFYKWGAGELYDEDTDSIIVGDFVVQASEPELGSANAYFSIDDYYDGDLQYKHRYNFSPYLNVYADTLSANDYCVRFTTKSVYCFSNGVFWINAKVHRNEINNGAHVTNSANGYMVCKLRIGDDWWNGTSWQHAEATFNVNIGNEDRSQTSGEGSIITTRHYYDNVDDYDGYGADVTGAVIGNIFFEINHVVLFNQPPENYNYIQLSDLEFGFARYMSGLEKNTKGNNVYTKLVNANNLDEVSIDTIFASDNGNPFGEAIILNADNTICKTVTYGNTAAHPEQHLVDTIAGFYSASGMILNWEIRSETEDITPMHKVTDKLWRDCYPIAISYDFKDSITRLTLIEL